MRATWLLAALAAVACATAPEVKAPSALESVASRQLEQDRAVDATLRSIASRARKGEGAAARQEYLEQSKARPLDPMPRLYAAWTGAPREDAWQEVARVTKLNPEEPWAWALSGAIYAQWHNFLDQADADFLKALGARKGFVPALVGRADVLRLRGKLPEARAAYEGILAAAPDWQAALSGLGLTLAAQEDPQARPTLEKALQIDPEDRAATAALARLAVASGDTDQAIALTTRMLEFNPRDREARLALARMKQGRKDLAGAAAELEAALALQADLGTAQSLAAIWRELGRGDDEMKALERVALLSPRDAEPLKRIAELKQATGDAEGAEAALKRASERRPDDPELLLALARLVKAREDLVASIEAFRLARAMGAPEAAAELKELEVRALLLEAPPAGDVSAVYGRVFARLNKSYQERAKKGSAPGGRLRVRVAIGEEGRATQVEMVEDTLHDEVLGALVYFSLKDAQYPKVKKVPTFEFVLGARK